MNTQFLSLWISQDGILIMRYQFYVPPAFHHRTSPSSPPVKNAPGDPRAEGWGRHETDQTSPVSCIVDTAARAPISQTLIVLSADLRNDDVNKNFELVLEQNRLTQKVQVSRQEKRRCSVPMTYGQ